MLKEIQKKLSDEVINEFGKRYGVSEGMLIPCESFESFVYRFEKPTGGYIMKITHSIIKDERQIASEIEFVNYMYNNGVSVSNVINSCLEKPIEAIRVDDGYFYARCYTKADGGRSTDEQWNPQLFNRWVRTMGKMHSLSKHFPQNQNFYRLQWNENKRLKYIPRNQTAILQSANEIISHLRLLPRSTEDYGIIHNDFHQGNFFISGNKLTVFDFDDMEYSWYINDIATVLYYAVYQNLHKFQDKDYPRRFFDNFIEGYNRENHIEQVWYKQIPYFLRLRHIILYVAYRQSFDLNNLQENQAKLLSRLCREIQANDELIDLSFGGY